MAMGVRWRLRLEAVGGWFNPGLRGRERERELPGDRTERNGNTFDLIN